MKISKLITFTAAMVSATPLFAQPGPPPPAPPPGQTEVVHVWQEPRVWWTGHFAYVPADRYTAYELNVDGFGSYIAGQRGFSDIFDTSIKGNRGSWGGGIGANYFLTRELGLGVDLNAAENGGNFIDMVSGNGIVRFPIEPAGLAPYIFGGGGRTTDQIWQWFSQAGVGLEYRFNPLTGLFIDGRYIWPDRSNDALLLRSGIRLVF